MKGTARKVRRIYNGKVLVGFAGGTADAFTLLDRFEAKLEKHQGNLTRAAVDLAKDWRTDRVLRRLEAMLIAADRDHHAGHHRQRRRAGPRGRHLRPSARAARTRSRRPRRCSRTPSWRPRTWSRRRWTIAGELCIYTNTNLVIETLE